MSLIVVPSAAAGARTASTRLGGSLNVTAVAVSTVVARSMPIAHPVGTGPRGWPPLASLLGHPSLAQAGEICGFEQGAGLRHAPPRARMGLQAGDAGKKIPALQPPGF